MAPACHCPACQLHRITAPLVLIAIGVLLLAHMAWPGFSGAEAVAWFLVFAGVLGLVNRLAPRAPGHASPASVFFPLLALVVGGLILARHALPQAPIGYWIAHYWPVLLILWGVTRLIEYVARSRPARSGLSGGEIVLLVLIIVFGLMFSGAYRFGHSRWADYWGVDVNGWNPFLQTYRFNASAHADAGAGTPATVVIRGIRGSVTLQAAPPGAPAGLIATVNDVVRADGNDRAQQIFSSAQPIIRQEGDSWLVLPAGASSSRLVDADLTLILPGSWPATVRLNNGGVTVPFWNANLDIQSTHGAISASNIHGDVRVSTGHDSVSLDGISGNVRIAGSGNDISVSNVHGAVDLEGEFVGSLNFRQLAQGLEFHSSRTSLAIAALPGSLVYDMGQISISNARAITLATRDAEIVVRRFTGPLDVRNRNESVIVSTTEPLAAPVSITNRNADITLSLPSASRFHLDTQVRNGDVQNAFGPAAEAASPTVSLQTSSGTITVRPGVMARDAP